METQRKILEKIISGWRKHHKEMEKKIEPLAREQNPQILSLCCSDSRVDLGVIFKIREQGRIFQIRNVGGLFTEDAKAAFVYALVHLGPQVILVVHHTRCGGYMALAEKEGVEEEIEYYMRENGGGLAGLRVDEYLKNNKRKLKGEEYNTTVIEEGARIQLDRMLYFLKVHYPSVHERIKGGRILLIPLMYDLASDEVYLLPEDISKSLEGRTPLSRLVL